MDKNIKIPKKQKQVTLWIHPEGRVVGSLFLSLQSKSSDGEEVPLEALNHPKTFVVLRRDDFDEVRFYNKASIVRVEYHKEELAESEEIDQLECRLCLMDGSIVEGTIKRALPPDYARLYDYLNMPDERFTEIHTGEGIVCLINKSYIVSVKSLKEMKRGDASWQPDGLAMSQLLA
ncbi:MAG: hypothetical protein V3S24_13655 [Candidatus Tectomicrobia bacterium]